MRKAEVSRQPIDHARTPRAGVDPLADQTADLPVQHDELDIGRDHRTDPALRDPTLDDRQDIPVVTREVQFGLCLLRHDVGTS